MTYLLCACRVIFQGLALPLVSRISKDVLRTLKFLATEMSMLHGDIKPENIMLVYDDAGQISVARVIDFGLAFRSRGDLKRNMYIQSRWYRSPEVLLGIPATPQIDVWSFGCMLVEMFTGECPFRGTDSYDQMLLIMDAMGMPSQQLRSHCEETTLEKLDEMSAIVSKRWQKHFGLAPGQARTPNEIQERLKRKLLIYRQKRTNETDAHRHDLVDLVVKLLRGDPFERFSAADALAHPFIELPSGPRRYDARAAAAAYVTAGTAGDAKMAKRTYSPDARKWQSSMLGNRSSTGFVFVLMRVKRCIDI